MHHIHIYHYTVQAQDVAPLTAALPLLSAARQGEIAAFALAHDRTLRIAASLLLQHALVQQLPTCTLPLVLERQAAGKPYLPSCPLHFSISHSGDVVYCAVAHVPVGVDVERIRSLPYKVMARNRTPLEKMWLYNRPDDDFFTLWTRKEAVVKALGVGLQQSFADFSVLDHAICMEGQPIALHSLPCAAGYRAAVAVLAPDILVFRTAMPELELTQTAISTSIHAPALYELLKSSQGDCIAPQIVV